MSEALLLFERDGAVARLTLNRPQAGNAVDMDLARALLEAAIECDSDPSIRCVTLTGAGKAFCTGGDIALMARSGDKVGAVIGELAGTAHFAMSRFARMDKPLVHLINGAAAGGGYGLAISGDIVLAARSAEFSAAYGALGVSPDCGLSWLLPRLVGLRRAQEIIISNRRITASEAEEMGIITRMVEGADLAEEGAKLAAKLASSATGAIGRSRQLLLSSFDNSLETQLELEARGIAAAVSGPEGREGVAAFLAKRKPDFAAGR